jgi:MazG family protein
VLYAVFQVAACFTPRGMSTVGTHLILVLAGLPYSAAPLLVRSMMADLGDEERLASGVDRTGLLYAIVNGTVKLGYALAIGVFIVLAKLGFDPKVPSAQGDTALIASTPWRPRCWACWCARSSCAIRWTRPPMPRSAVSSTNGTRPSPSPVRARNRMSPPSPVPNPPLNDPREKDQHPLFTLIDIMAKLRDPDGGCPWDLEQTFATVAPYTVEEAYEVADAIERGDLSDLKEELGDLLLQVVFHSRMAEEQGAFDLAGVASAINDKMVRRHPHVFGDHAYEDQDAQTAGWEALKAQERQAKAKGGVLDDVPAGLPAMTRAVKLTKRAARVGFDWPSTDEVLDKLAEEVAELKVEIAAGDKAKAREELGDLLFVVANLARKLDIEPEDALRATNAKFVRRFSFIEAELAKDGRTPDQSDLAEMDGLWDAAKAARRSRRGALVRSPGPCACACPPPWSERRPVVQIVDLAPGPHARVDRILAHEDRRLGPAAAQQADQRLAVLVDPPAHLVGHGGLLAGVQLAQHGRGAQRPVAEIVGPGDQGGGLVDQQRGPHPGMHVLGRALHVAQQQLDGLGLGDGRRRRRHRLAGRVADRAVADGPRAARQRAVVVIGVGEEPLHPLDDRRGGGRHRRRRPRDRWPCSRSECRIGVFTRTTRARQVAERISRRWP